MRAAAAVAAASEGKKSIWTKVAKALDALSPSISAGGQVRQQFATLSAAKSRLTAPCAREEERIEALGAKLEGLSKKRIEALTAARLSGGEADANAAAELLSQADALRRERDDASAVLANLQEKESELELKIGSLEREYRLELVAFLDALYIQAMECYNALAPDVAKAIMRVAAIRRAMIELRIGNSNGWTGEALLPCMMPHGPTYIRPLLDAASEEFAAAARDLVNDIHEEIRAAGFTHG